MTVTVTLHVFSGRPDPVWQLTELQEHELNEKLTSARSFVAKRPSGVFGGLGYRGFSLSRAADHPSGPLSLRVHEGIVDRGGAAAPNLVDNVELESWLAEIGRPHLPNEVHEHVLARLREGPEAVAFQFPETATAAACPPCHAVDAPAYNPGMWNTPTVQPHNNCYNYANDRITNTFAQPGRAAGHQATVMACPNVTAGATSDGLHSVPNFGGTLAKGAGWYVAVVVWPNADYHWYRQDNVGCWSHKPGQTAARNVDNSGHPITDPKTCNRGPYINFCTYMVTNRSVHIQ